MQTNPRDSRARKDSAWTHTHAQGSSRARGSFLCAGEIHWNRGLRFCKVTASEVFITRFDILAILATQSRPISCARIAELTWMHGRHGRSFHADLATRLRRLRRWGLLKRWSARAPVLGASRAKYLWSITQRGRERLAWGLSQTQH